MAALLHDVMEDTGCQQRRDRRTLRRAGRRTGRRPLQAGQDRVPERRGSAGGKLPQDAAGDGARRARDPVKLADRCTTCARSASMPPDKRRRIARETHGNLCADRQPPWPQQYLPRTAGPGLRASVSASLPDLAKAVKSARGNRREVVSKILEAVKQRARQCRHPGAGVTGREKTPVRHLPQDAEQAFVVLAGARRLRFSRRGRQLPRCYSRSARCMRCTSRCRASSRITSPSRR